jgi:putative nucleotidyltransferase with HDIG domain
MAASRGSVTIDGQLMATRGGKTCDLETLLLPLEVHGKTLGQLSLGKRLSGEAYSEDDIEILAAVAHQAATSVENVSFREQTLRQASELKETFESLLVALATSIDARHPLTGSHTQRVTRYAVQLAEEIGLDEEEIDRIRIASLLHDIGKIGIPDAILTKPGAFTDEEFAIMKRHAVITREILSTIRFSPSLQSVPEIAGGHHEKYNGRGYPEGLAGEGIPLGSRIIALADVYDALTSKRDYRAAMPIGQVVAILEEGTGQHFDPVLAPRFLELICREAKEEG